MSKRGFGFVLILTFAVSSAAFFQIYRLERVAADENEAFNNISRSIDSTEIALANMRAAQAAVLAAGQGPDFWMKRVTELAGVIERNVSDLASRTKSPDARAQYDSAMASLTALNALDQKARDHVANGGQLVASDVVFTDEKDSAQRIADALEAAFVAEHEDSGTRIGSIRNQRLAFGAGAFAVLLLGFVILGARKTRVEYVQVPAPAPAPPPVAAVPVRADDAPRHRTLDFVEAAEVCVDLARVLDGGDIPALLARVAGVLEAKGLVLWVADASGSTLQPSLCHGYSERVLSRLGPLEVNADNITSRTFRSLQPQMLSGRSEGANAIAVPLITAAGCIGVLAAELVHSPPARETVSIARIFAAQLATVVGPAADSGVQTAQGAG
jgi:hypothetical protein